MSVHALFVESLLPGAEEVVVTGAEALHAVRVRRMRPGDQAMLLNGAGLVARAEVISAGREVVARVVEIRQVAPERPAVHVWSATPKGARLSELIDSLSQVGAASWTPLRTDRGVVDPGAGKLERLRRITIESAKQSHRAWLLALGEPGSLENALGQGARGAGPVIIADGAGEPYIATGAAAVRLLIGPEGGWTETELARARAGGAIVASFGPHIMRVETAAPVAAAIVIHAEHCALRGSESRDAD